MNLENKRQQILVVDDEPLMVDTVATVLAGDGFDVLQAEDGEQGLQLARAYIPDLIVTDIYMPKLTGTEMLAALREDPSTATIPVILTTGHAERTTMRKGMRLGADDFLVKPFSSAELLDAVRARLQRRRQMHEQAEATVAQLRASLGTALPHELLTPLTGILGFADLLQMSCETLQPNDIYEMAASIRESGKRLLRLIQNYLLFLELERLNKELPNHQSSASRKPIFTREIVQTAAHTCADKAGRSSDLVLELTECPVAMSIDFVTKLIEELVDNALKFSKNGQLVKVTTSSNPEGFHLSVCDHGRGMNAAQIAQISAYRQFERQRYEQQGLGLGLAIVKQLVKTHGGTFAIHSQVASGTTVEILLPVSAVSPK